MKALSNRRVSPFKGKRVLVMLSSPVEGRMDGVARYAREHGWHLMFQDRMGFTHPFDWMGDGVVATVRQERRSLAFLKRLAMAGVPIVDLTCDVSKFPCARVSADHVAAGRLAAEHLAERNYKSRAFFTMDWGNVRERLLRGFAGDGAVARWVFTKDCPHTRWDDWAAVGRWLAGKFAAAEKPIGVLTYSQGEAARLLDVAQGLGIKVPEELGIVSGNDDPILLENQPVPITAVDTDLERGAYEAAALLDRLMEGSSVEGQKSKVEGQKAKVEGQKSKTNVEIIEIPPISVVVRQSTAEAVAADPLVAAALRLFAGRLGRGGRGVEEVARKLGVGRNTLDRRFTAELGRSASAELHRQRLALARRLLSDPANKVEWVARVAGFSSASHLGTAMRADTGMSPRELRRP